MGALQAMGRNPEAAGEIRTNMILGIVFAEAIAIYALVIALLLLFVGAPGLVPFA
jgi:F-type H+-transporting ATPase subunit c